MALAMVSILGEVVIEWRRRRRKGFDEVELPGAGQSTTAFDRSLGTWVVIAEDVLIIKVFGHQDDCSRRSLVTETLTEACKP